MSNDRRYNGWKNYETWVTKLWMDNDEGSYHYWREQAQEVYDQAEPRYEWENKEQAARSQLADLLKSEHEENTPETVGVCADLLNAALSEIDWYEIAQALIDDEVDKTVKVEEIASEGGNDENTNG